MALTVAEYVPEDGSNPYRTWFDGLDPQAAAKVTTAILRLEMGNISRVKWIGAMVLSLDSTGAIGECRIDWGPGYRVYLASDGNALIVLFGGGTKGRQQADIRRAEALFARVQGPKSRCR